MTNSSFVVNVTTADFIKVVLEGSSQRPVLVDFWANWCAPCRALGPILEKIAQEWDGKLLVAKIDTDQEKSLSAQLGIRSLPTVRLFQNGRSIGEFMGALPESEVRAFLNRHLPHTSDSPLRPIEQLLAQGKWEAAQTAFDALPMQEHNSAEAKTVKARLMFARLAAQAPKLQILEERLTNNPNDSEARYQLAVLQVIAGANQLALDNLLTLLRKDRNYGEDAARKGMLLIFDLLGGSGELVSRYRAKLTNALF